MRRNCGMTARGDLYCRRKEPNPHIVIRRCWRQDEGSLGIVEFPSERLHLIIRKPVSVCDHAGRISRKTVFRKCVHLVDAICLHSSKRPNSFFEVGYRNFFTCATEDRSACWNTQLKSHTLIQLRSPVLVKNSIAGRTTALFFSNHLCSLNLCKIFR